MLKKFISLNSVFLIVVSNHKSARISRGPEYGREGSFLRMHFLIEILSQVPDAANIDEFKGMKQRSGQ